MTRTARLLTVAVVLSLVAGCAVDETEAVCPIPDRRDFEAARVILPTPDATSDPNATSSAPIEVTTQVLVVTAPIPAGMTVQSLVNAPTAHLTAELMNPSLSCATTIHTVGELGAYLDQVFLVEVPSDQALDVRYLGPAG